VRKPAANLNALKRDQGKVEQAILDLQTKKHALEARLSTPLPPQEIGELGRQLQKIDEELAAHEENWLQISEQIEAAGA
jgi:ATP-binding cassette subfamily F protein 3